MEPAFEPHLSVRFRWAGVALIVAAALYRLVYLGWHCPLDLAPDEAHYWNWSRQLDWCYYSKGPLVAWLIRLSCEFLGPLSQSLTGSEVLAIRFPAVVCGSLLLVGVYASMLQVYRNDALAFGVVALALTLPVVAAGASLMTIDAPFLCAWIWALVFAQRAVMLDARWPWLVAGVCVAIGVLAKHTMLLWVPSFALFLAATPFMRHHLRSANFWIMLGIGALGGIPILVWNALNGWPMLEHSRLHVGVAHEFSFHWLGPLKYVAGQVAVTMGLGFLVWAYAMWERRPGREAAPAFALLWWMSAPIFVFFGLFSFFNGGGEPNWPLAAYLSGLVLGADTLMRALYHPHRLWAGLARAGVVTFAGLGLVIAVLIHEPLPMQPILLRLAGPATERHPMPIRRVDPTCRLRGWRHLACEVDRVRAELRQRGIEPVLAGQRWTHASELGFYCEGQPTVFCLGPLTGDRRSQFELWRPNPIHDPSEFVGRTFIIVGPDVEMLRPAFATLGELRDITYRERGIPIAQWKLTVASGYRADFVRAGFNYRGLSSR
ncbi:MAG: glycosyltransferase family 39 protein [Planctomycetes bacterium]|nr:glycosyltransferase family 39 protein [Planctomycetota bacterium]